MGRVSELGVLWVKVGGQKKRGGGFHSPAAGLNVLRCCSPASCTRLSAGESTLLPVDTDGKKKNNSCIFVYKKAVLGLLFSFFVLFFLARFEG